MKNLIKSPRIMFSETDRERPIVKILKYFKMFSSYIGQVNSFPFLLNTIVVTLDNRARELSLPVRMRRASNVQGGRHVKTNNFLSVIWRFVLFVNGFKKGLTDKTVSLNYWDCFQLLISRNEGITCKSCLQRGNDWITTRSVEQSEITEWKIFELNVWSATRSLTA